MIDIINDRWIDQALLLCDNIYQPIQQYIARNNDRVPQDVMYNTVMKAIGEVSMRFNADTRVTIAYEAVSKGVAYESVLLCGGNAQIENNIIITAYNRSIENSKIPAEEKFIISHTGVINEL